METLCPAEICVTSVVPYIHVANVARSIAFYEKVGMVCATILGSEGQPYWAKMTSQGAQIMLARADGPVDPRVQAVLFYFYTPDLVAMRQHLLAHGLADLGENHGIHGDPFPESGAVCAIMFPHYLPGGEMRVHDPDGYVLQFANSPEVKN